VKAPSKNQLKAPAKPASNEDIQPFAISTDGAILDQLAALKIDPADAQAAADAVAKAISQLESQTANSGRAVLQSQGPNQPKRLVALQLYSAKSLAVELHRGADGSYGFKLAPNATESDDERVSSLPSTGTAAGPGARSIVSGSVGLVKVSGAGLVTDLASTGASNATLKELQQALAGFAPGAAKLDVWRGRTVDGLPRILVASLGDGANRQSFWWFAPPNQPEGWFDENGRRLGSTVLNTPQPEARISSPFGIRRYYGRRSGGGFHNGIDFEGKTGQPIYAAADGVINHQGWYFNYGRTVKVSHADNFETLYAHMSRFADGMGPGSRVRKGDLIGYVGSTGRSTGPHLHFSVIVNGQFVDPAPYLTEMGVHSTLTGESLVVFRQWQQEVRQASKGAQGDGRGWFRSLLQNTEPWSHNPFSSSGVDRL
ncbi:MAG: M23 family metallopeptidase, partial [Alphaproteobacteria bacterium]|nr:M23 family metallopeptidase [Alphaproteobacteria bacterium]